MKASKKILSLIIVFFLIIAIVIVARTVIGNHFKKKFSKRPPPGIIVFKVSEKYFSEKIESFGTAIPKVSIFSANSLLITSVTIIPGGGLLLNFFLKWFPIIVLPIITNAIIKKNTNSTEIIFVDLFIYFLS